MNDWISVEDRLPEQGEFILVVTTFTNLATVELICASPKHPNWRRYYTHWMPLPEPPKGKTEND